MINPPFNPQSTIRVPQLEADDHTHTEDPRAEVLRDRGLLAYHLNDFSSALRDLQTYLSLATKSELDQEERDERAQIWEHVKTLRRHVATLN